jgi:hypothetical protein
MAWWHKKNPEELKEAPAGFVSHKCGRCGKGWQTVDGYMGHHCEAAGGLTPREPGFVLRS